MRHHNTKRKFGRGKTQRRALLYSLALNLIVRGKIKTTMSKAKELRPFVEKLVTKARQGDLRTRKLVIARLSNRSREVKKLFEVIAPKYAGRNGGYTRVLKLPARVSDGVPMAQIEFI